jgi:putative heme-binding domain-containing protein
MRSKVISVLIVAVAAAGFSGFAAAQHATPFDIQDGERAYGESCVTCHGPDGNLIEGIDLGRGLYRRPFSDEELLGVIMNGIPDTPMPPNPGMSEEQARRIVTYLRAWAEEGRVAVVGDVDRGREIYYGKGTCDDCHAINGRGGRHAPDLSRVGRELRAVELQGAVVEPNAYVRPTARSYRVTLADGDVVTGRLLNHDTFTVQLIDSEQKLRSFIKADLRDHGFVDSTMPSYADTLSQEEITDLVSYLVSLQGQAND